MRLIDADALLDDIGSAGMGYIVARTIEHYVKRMQPVDAVPVVHGQWIDCDEDPNEKCCSACNHERNACNSWWNYCPNCGARMDLK